MPVMGLTAIWAMLAKSKADLVAAGASKPSGDACCENLAQTSWRLGPMSVHVTASSACIDVKVTIKHL
jgi:hypothetical protein